MKRLALAAFLALIAMVSVFVERDRDDSRSAATALTAQPVQTEPAASSASLEGEAGFEILTVAAVAPPPSRLGRLIQSLTNGGTRGQISRPAIELFLESRGRTARSLIAAWQESGEMEYLREAAAHFPEDARVAFAMLDDRVPAEERAAAFERFKANAPDNPLANYLAAREQFRDGQPDAALREMSAAAGKSGFDDYVREFVAERETLYLTAGLEPVEARLSALFGQVLPYLAPLRDLSKELTARQTDAMVRGDHAAALDLAGGTLAMGGQLSSDGTHTLITQLVGIAIESQALAPLDPAQPVQLLGRTVAERKAELNAQKTEIRTLSAAADITRGEVSDADILAYLERMAANGEIDALRWFAARRQP